MPSNSSVAMYCGVPRIVPSVVRSATSVFSSVPSETPIEHFYATARASRSNCALKSSRLAMCSGSTFNRDRAIEPRVACLIHFAHAAFAYRRNDFIGAEFFTGKERHSEAISLSHGENSHKTIRLFHVSLLKRTRARSDCRIMLSNVPRLSGSCIGTGTVTVPVPIAFA